MRTVKKFLLVFVFSILPCMTFAYGDGDSYDISEVYVEMDLGYETYFAEINGSSIMSTEFGEVKSLYKKARISNIGYGKYVVQIKWITDDFYKIVGTSYVIKLRFASRFEFSGYDDWILDTTSGVNGSVTKKEH